MTESGVEWNTTGKKAFYSHWKLRVMGRDEKLPIVAALASSFSKSTKISFLYVDRARNSPNKLLTMVHSQCFRIFLATPNESAPH